MSYLLPLVHSWSQEAEQPPNEETIMIHDLLLSVTFLSMIIAPAFVALRADSGEHDAQ